MKFVVEALEYSYKKQCVSALSRALDFHGNEVMMWNKEVKSTIDMLDEQKPDFVLFNTPITDTAKEIGKMYNTTFISSDMLQSPVSDVLLYKPMPVNKMFVTDVVCFLQYPEFEMHDDPCLLTYLSTRNKGGFRFYSPIVSSSSKYCGIVPQNQYASLFSSAKKVVCLSEHSAINAKLCNPNVYLKDKPFDKDLNFCLRISNLELSKQLFDLNSFDRAAMKVKNEAYYKDTFGYESSNTST